MTALFGRRDLLVLVLRFSCVGFWVGFAVVYQKFKSFLGFSDVCVGAAAVLAMRVISVHRGVEMECRSRRLDKASVSLDLYKRSIRGEVEMLNTRWSCWILDRWCL